MREQANNEHHSTDVHDVVTACWMDVRRSSRTRAAAPRGSRARTVTLCTASLRTSAHSSRVRALLRCHHRRLRTACPTARPLAVRATHSSVLAASSCGATPRSGARSTHVQASRQAKRVLATSDGAQTAASCDGMRRTAVSSTRVPRSTSTRSSAARRACYC